MSEEKTPEEPEETSKEFSRPEYLRRFLYLGAAFAALIIISIIPTPPGLSTGGQRALGILGFVTILWATEAFPLGLTALFGAMLLPVLGIVKPAESFIGFGSTALFFLVGAISFGIAMQKTNLHKRVAVNFLRRFGNSSTSIILSVCLMGGFMSMTMPEHAVAALLLPVMMGVVEAGNIGQRENFGIAIFLALTYATSVGSIGTLLGGARNVLALGIFEKFSGGVALSFLNWAIAGVPIAIVLMLVTFFVLKLVYPWKEVNTRKIRSEMEEEMTEIGPISNAEKKAAIIFAVAFILWVTVGTSVGLATVAVGGLILLVITRTLTWRDIEQNMPWGILFLYGGALTLSHALTKTGSVNFLATKILGVLGQNLLAVMIILLLIVILISNLMSNSAATAVILPIALGVIITKLGLPGELPTYLIAMGSAMAFMLPIATPSAAIAYSSGYIKIRDLMKAGALMSLVSIIVFLTFGLGWWKLIGVW